MIRIICFVVGFTLFFFPKTVFSLKYQDGVKLLLYKQFGNASNDPELLLGYNHLVVIKKDTFIVPNGYHYVFKLVNGIPIRQDESTFHGGNFGRFLFNYNNTIYALGGYGFFNTNNNLEYYNSKLKGWAVQSMSGDKPKHILGIAYLFNNQIISFNNYKAGNSINKDELDSSLYIMDLKNMKWRKFHLSENACQIGRVYHLRDYIISIGELNTIIIHKYHKQFIRIENEKYGFDLAHNHIEKILLNTIYLNTNSNHKKEALTFEINLAKLWKETPKYLLISEQKSTSKTNRYAIILIGLFVLLGVFYFIFRKKHKQALKSTIEYSEIELRLLNAKKILITEEMDEIFEITHLELDARKLKRSRMIEEINSKFPNFIIREKDNNDKRKFVYRING